MLDMPGRLLWMSGRELRFCRTFCLVGFNTHRMSDKETKNDHCYLRVINWEKNGLKISRLSRLLAAAPYTIQFPECYLYFELSVGWMLFSQFGRYSMPRSSVPRIPRTDCPDIDLVMNWLNTIQRTVSSKYRQRSGNWWRGVAECWRPAWQNVRQAGNEFRDHYCDFIFYPAPRLFKTCRQSVHFLNYLLQIV